MGITRALSISYGGITTDDDLYVLHGPYTIDKDFGSMTTTWQIVVTTSGTDTDFYDACAALELALNARDGSLVITWPGGDFQFLFGVNALNSTCAFSKSGDRETDTGKSRSYTVTFTSLLPATDEGGMFSIQSEVSYDPSRVQSLSMSGEVRGQNGASAWDRYQSIISTWDSQIQNIVDSSAVWELVAESVDFDRNNHVVTFQRGFAQLIDPDAPDTGGPSDRSNIVQQRIIFTRISAYPGDTDPDVNRPERFMIEYSARINSEDAIGLDQLSSLYEDTIFDWIKQRFSNEWGPQSFAVVDHQRQFHPSTNLITARLIVMAYMEGSDVLESSRTETYRDERNIDYTPVWDGSELSAYADQGFMVRLREVVETKVLLGSHEAESPLEVNNVLPSGWNRISGSSAATPLFVGEPPDQVETTVISTSSVERYTEEPSNEGGEGPTTPGTGRTPTPPEEEADAARRIAEITGNPIPGSTRSP